MENRMGKITIDKDEKEINQNIESRTNVVDEARIRILEDKVKELQLVIDKIPLSDIDNVTLKYRGSKKRWKFNPKNEEPDFLMTERVLKWTDSELIRRGVI